MDRMTFTSVNLGEKVMKASSDISVVISFFPLSSVSSSVLPLHHVVLLVNVKWVNVGINTTDGCATMVLSMSVCQQEKTPRKNPGKNIVAMMVAISGTWCSSGIW